MCISECGRHTSSEKKNRMLRLKRVFLRGTRCYLLCSTVGRVHSDTRDSAPARWDGNSKVACGICTLSRQKSLVVHRREHTLQRDTTCKPDRLNSCTCQTLKLYIIITRLRSRAKTWVMSHPVPWHAEHRFHVHTIFLSRHMTNKNNCRKTRCNNFLVCTSSMYVTGVDEAAPFLSSFSRLDQQTRPGENAGIVGSYSFAPCVWTGIAACVTKVPTNTPQHASVCSVAAVGVSRPNVHFQLCTGKCWRPSYMRNQDRSNGVLLGTHGILTSRPVSAAQRRVTSHLRSSQGGHGRVLGR